MCTEFKETMIKLTAIKKNHLFWGEQRIVLMKFYTICLLSVNGWKNPGLNERLHHRWSYLHQAEICMMLVCNSLNSMLFRLALERAIAL
ncbi:hypothetical protein AAC978_10190 [Desulfitobacterium sp. THU1]